MGLILESAINLNKEMHLKPNVVSQIKTSTMSGRRKLRLKVLKNVYRPIQSLTLVYYSCIRISLVFLPLFAVTAQTR